MNSKKIMFLTRTAVMLALLMGVQFATRGFGTFVTGSLVNMILLMSGFTIGLGGGLIVAALSNFLAFMAGIGPAAIQIVPFVAIANVIFVLCSQLCKKNITKLAAKDMAISGFCLFGASLAKMAFLWLALAKAALPMIPGLNEKQVAVIGATFTWPQLVTALIGSALALIIAPLLTRALKRPRCDA